MTARAACLVARARGASRVIVAVPVGTAEAVASLRRDAHEVICLHTPASFVAIGGWYQDFSQVPDAEVAGSSPGRDHGDRAVRVAQHGVPDRSGPVRAGGCPPCLPMTTRSARTDRPIRAQAGWPGTTC